MVSLNGDHTPYQYQDFPEPGDNPVISLLPDDIPGGGIATMMDGRVLSVTQNTQASATARFGYSTYATARFVSGASVGTYATIWDSETLWPNGVRVYSGMQASYQQMLPLGDYCVVSFWSAGHHSSVGFEDRFDIVLLDVSGAVPTVVDSLGFYGGINEPDIGKVADDVFVYWDGGSGSSASTTAYRVGPGGFTAGAPTAHGTTRISNGIAGVGGSFLVAISQSISGSDYSAWLGTVNLTTLAITKDAHVGINSPWNYPGNTAINLSMTVRLPEPRIGLVTGNNWADLYEIERIGNTAQVSGYFINPWPSDAYFFYNVGHSWPVAYDSAGKAIHFVPVWDNVNPPRFYMVEDLFGTPVTTQIDPPVDWPEVDAKFNVLGLDTSFGHSMDAAYGSDGTLYLRLQSSSWFTTTVEPNYGGLRAGNLPWGQQYVAVLGGNVGQLYVNLSHDESAPNWVSVCAGGGNKLDPVVTGNQSIVSGWPNPQIIYGSGAVWQDGDDATYTRLTHLIKRVGSPTYSAGNTAESLISASAATLDSWDWTARASAVSTSTGQAMLHLIFWSNDPSVPGGFLWVDKYHDVAPIPDDGVVRDFNGVLTEADIVSAGYTLADFQAALATGTMKARLKTNWWDGFPGSGDVQWIIDVHEFSIGGAGGLGHFNISADKNDPDWRQIHYFTGGGGPSWQPFQVNVSATETPSWRSCCSHTP